MHTALNRHGTLSILPDSRRLLAELATPAADCLILDPALLTPSVAETTAALLAEYPRDVVAFSSVTTAALQSAVILAQRTSARFVFRGTPNERSALERALLLTPYAELSALVLALIEPQMNHLPAVIRDRVAAMFRDGDGPHSPDALAAATALTRRSVDRCLADAGFVSARRLVEAARTTSGYRAITTPGIPLVRIAEMLGYNAKRTMDAQLNVLLDTNSGALRARPLSCAEAASRLARSLTDAAYRETRKGPRARSDDPGTVKPSLRLIRSETQTSRGRRKASGDTVMNQ